MTEENQEKTEITDRLNKQLNTPVLETDARIPVERTWIGPFKAQTESYTLEKSEKTPPKPTIIEETRVINTSEDWDKYYTDFAHQSGSNIVMMSYQLSEDLTNEFKDAYPGHIAEYLNGNPAVRIATYFHELAHYNREHNQIHHISGANEETNFALNYVNEKSAYVIQNIALVNIYNHCKENNMEYLVYKDTKIKIDELLDMFPNLRECVEKNGTDLKSDKTLTAIAKTASEIWDKDDLPNYYEESMYDNVRFDIRGNIVQQIQAVKEGQKAMSEQLKNIDIGYGMKIDLPEECKSFIYPDKQYLHNLFSQGNREYASNEGLLAIDEYLEQRGLKNNKEKHEYIKEQYEKIVNRTPDADQTLKELMLDAELNPANDRCILYTDGLLQKNINGIPHISPATAADAHFYPINQENTPLADELKKQQETYSPTSLSPELTTFRSLNNTKMNMALSHHQDQPDNIKTEQIRETSVTQTVVSKQNLKHNTGR